MAKRLRYVHPVDMVAHLWANRSQDSARNPGNNFYFDRETIYSYGNHFPIARHVETKRGRAVLFTTRDYSVTTSGHKWTVLGACKHLTVFHVQHPTDSDRKAQFVEYRQRYVELARRYTRARSNKPWILGSLRDVVDEANRFAQFFGLRSRLSMPADLSAMEAECKAVEKREHASKQRAAAKRQREALERLQKWVDGETDFLCQQSYGPSTMRTQIFDNGVKLWLSANDTYCWAQCWPCSELSGNVTDRNAHLKAGHVYDCCHPPAPLWGMPACLTWISARSSMASQHMAWKKCG